MDPALLEEALARRARMGRLPRAVVVVHLYGQSADLDAIMQVCERYGVVVVEDAAEALGARYRDRHPGTFGKAGIYSFNGNKIITTSGGGMLVTEDAAFAIHARKLATQARDPAPHYQHSEVGYNYRLSNVLAAVGRAQLRSLEEKVAARRRNFEFYRTALGDLPGIEFMPEAEWGRHTRWLTCITVDAGQLGSSAEDLRLALEAVDIEARPVWKPMHTQPVFAGFPAIGGSVAEDLFARGLCLPSGSSLTRRQLERVADVIRATVPAGVAAAQGTTGRPLVLAGAEPRPRTEPTVRADAAPAPSTNGAHPDADRRDGAEPPSQAAPQVDEPPPECAGPRRRPPPAARRPPPVARRPCRSR
jgi:dTDP-4-amino-4,6-dideoxygalactose transaminase